MTNPRETIEAAQTKYSTQLDLIKKEARKQMLIASGIIVGLGAVGVVLILASKNTEEDTETETE